MIYENFLNKIFKNKNNNKLFETIVKIFNLISLEILLQIYILIKIGIYKIYMVFYNNIYILLYK